VFFVWGRNAYEKYTKQMTNKINNWKQGDFAFFELHGGDAAPYMEFRHLMKEWRAMADAKGIPFFAFTIVREPISFATSYYTYYHTQRIGGFQQFKNTDFDEQNLLSLAMPSPQCLFLTRTENAYRDEAICASHASWQQYVCGAPLRQNFSDTECTDAYQSLHHDLDWVGVTHQLGMETFPLLQAVANDTTVVFPTLNSSGRKVHRSQLSATAIAYLQSITTGDNDIYQQTLHDFPITIWENYRPAAAADAEVVTAEQR